MLSSINETFGAAYIGIVVAAMMLGISVIQGFYYFTHQKDGWILRGLVAAVLAFDFIHQVLITHTGTVYPAFHVLCVDLILVGIGYVYLITFWQQPEKLRIVVWSLLAEVLFNGLTAFCVQCFLTYRIWMLSGTKVWLTATVISFLNCTHYYRFNFASFLRVKTFEQLSAELKGLSLLPATFSFAGILTFLLQRSKTGFRKSDTMINKLTIFAVNTGALTSLCAIASLISILAAPDTFIYISFFFSMGRLYTNSLLATLNARKMIRESAKGINTTSGENVSIPCHDYTRRDSPSKLVFQHSKNLNTSTNISIQVDTTREFVSDTEHGIVTRARCLADFKHGEVEVEEEDLSEANLSNGDVESNFSSGIDCTAV
ncbi:hypothetical protein J3R30DRAFT_3491908 [Lentinula aciculospora]|uniref:DUF6534 domain-containing protein n=1 Tax=Lentinula aciculospora TaxID=153920 RepID=A0A9W9A7C6_9AGAR|nr:hypothetical protein J3R30DRAFT_3491908 [Lentinula aciculospora]